VLGTNEAVSAGEAMLCYTANGARALGLENELGAIARGKDADLIVLPRDPLTDEDPVRLTALRPSAVIVRGKVVHGAFA
jgi:imidazolonepropionase-like amidohydrolase